MAEPEKNPYPAGTYAHAEWNLHRAFRNLGESVAEALNRLSQRMGKR